MRAILAATAVLLATGSAIPQTYLGNCGANITGIQLSTGNIYCITAPSACGDGQLKYSVPCNAVFQTGIVQ